MSLWATWRQRTRPAPWVRADIGAWVPGWLVRLSAGLVAGVTAGLGWWLAGPQTAAIIAGIIGLAWTAMAPSTASWAVCVAFLAATRLVSGQATGLGWALVFAGLAYATSRATWWAGHIRARGRVSLRAIGLAAWRDGVVVALTGLFGGLAWWAGRAAWAAGPVAAPVLLVLGALAVIALSLVIARLVRSV